MSDRILEIKLPKLGESIVSATVVQWLKEEGDHVSQDEPILEVSTDKVNSEIPAPQSGVLTEILVQVNEEVDVGAPLAKLLIEKKADSKVSPEIEKTQAVNETDESTHFLSPAVLKMAREKGISLDALSEISGSGHGGRVTKKDLENYLNATEEPDTKVEDSPLRIEKLPMGSLRKAIAANLVRSFYEAPHASLVAEVDVTDLMTTIKAKKDSFKKEHGVKLTITSFIIKAITEAIQHFPMVNASIEKDTILMKHFVNMGVAVSIEKGVVVPVIKNCQDKALCQIAKEVVKLAEKARTNSVAQEDLESGTITMTNFGMSGMQIGIPIIKYPEVAIIGVGSIHKKVAALADNSIAIRNHVYMTLTFDHRLIDGIYGANFLNHIKDVLEKVPE
ncbi:MAG: Dihydrolipoyllysine-residue acetyltransferase component of pyruvate dehydrogenase complex [Chlamydiae bacterium]|nr:Dihydrolipoyllysine-residue acetyltransferase component of pyruvate dehydrogenase complex [Chlamydiota bacterium]